MLPQRPLTRAQLEMLGASRAMVRTRVDNGDLLQLRPGVYLAALAWPEEPVARHLLRAEALHLALPGSVVSHHSAGLEWGLSSPPDADWAAARACVTTPAGGSRRSWRTDREQVIVAPLPPSELVTTRSGNTVTSVYRTTVDIAAGYPGLPEKLCVLDSGGRVAVKSMMPSPRRSAFSSAAIADLIRQGMLGACEGRRGFAATRQAIAEFDPRRESPIESLTAGHLILNGLPRPELQPPIRTELGELYPDFLWRELRVIGEADGAVKYVDSDAMMREKAREQVLRDAGYAVVRWTGREVTRTPMIVVDRISRALNAAGWRL